MPRLGSMADEPEFTTVSASPRYPDETDAAVRYLPVMLDEILVGYLWIAVTGDAVDFMTCAAGDSPAMNAGVAWVRRLRQSKADGLTAPQAFQRWAARPDEPGAEPRPGAVPPGAEVREMPSLEALRELADDGGPMPMAPAQAGAFQRYRSKVVGCLAGGAIGDALGAPVEFCSLDTIRQRFGAAGITGYERYAGGLGLITDDTQMTLFTAEGLITTMIADDNVHSRLGSARPGNAWADPAPHVYRSYLRWLETQSARQAPRPAPSWLAGQDWLYSSRAPGSACTSGLASGPMGTRATPRNPGSKGCGTVMRAAPFGLQKAKEAAEVFEEAVDASVLTHGHPSGYLAAGALAVIVGSVMEDQPLPFAVRGALYHLRGHPGHEEVTAALTAATDAARAGTPGPEAVESLGGGWTAEEALAIAVYAALCYPDPGQFREALLLAVNHSGDSDSTGSVCGNILGAWHGPWAFPADLASQVEGADTLNQIADDFAEVNWPQWRRRAAPEHLAELAARYPAGRAPSGDDADLDG